MSASGEIGLAVRARGLCKSYGSGDGSIQVLRGVDFEARFGEMLMIVGPSGCGKTTLLSVICGTLKHEGGELEVLGESLAAMRASRLTSFRGRNIGFVFQQFNLIPTWTSLENVSVPLLLNGASRAEAEAAARSLLEEVGLGDRTGAYPAQLSGGQQQRVAIARALVHQPRILVCDEPTAALDAGTGRRVLELLKRTACGPDRCVIVVTHDSRIFSFADRIAEMDDGVIKKFHGPGEYNAAYV